jgi:mono/diheme cytochrome c family protein
MRILVLAIFLGMLAGAAPAQQAPPGPLFQEGKEVFTDNCAQCHRVGGEGLPGTFPALNGDPFVTGDPGPVIATVLNGRKGKLGQMPTWKDKLNDAQVAAVVTYIRGAWSNRAPGITPQAVAAVRQKSGK